MNADESEPGTYKDRLIMERDPHQLIEACVVSSHGIRSQAVLHLHPRRVLAGHPHARAGRAPRPTRPATWAGTSWAPASTWTSSCTPGAGAYECGEETALIESLEGKRGQPRIKPPFPATHGLYGCPTIVNNVETLACVPLILERGAEWFVALRHREERRAQALLRLAAT